MVHLIRSLLINLNSIIGIEAKYVELCKYTVAYTVLTKKLSSAVEEGPRNACRCDLQCTSVLEMRGLMVPLYSTVGSYWSNWCVRKGGSLPLRQNFAPTNHFWRGQSASWAQPLSRQTRLWTRPYHVNDVSRFVFRAVSHQGGNVLIADVVSNSAKH